MSLPLADQLLERWIDQLSIAPEADLPTVAYHYTTSAGLFGILDRKCIFATDKHFLNDRMEVRHGTDAAITSLKKTIGKIRDGPHKELLRAACTYMAAESDERHFIFSMSERSDDLSQWRGYANEGNGFTIGFDAAFFRRSSVGNDAPYGFNRVSYSESSFSSTIERLSSAFSKELESEEDLDNTAMCLSATLEVAACYHKHNSFKFEREWRLVSHVYPDGAEEVLVRTSNDRLLPYIELPLLTGDTPLPILEIGIGPSVPNPNARRVVEDLCKRARISPRIYNANTPFVRY